MINHYTASKLQVMEENMSNKNKKLNESFAEEKARVRLYKSGKNWVKAGIREIQLMRVMGLSLIHI